MREIIRWLVLIALMGSAVATLATAPQNIGFYYGTEAPVESLMAYDWVVLQPDHTNEARLDLLRKAQSRPLAYISIGEIARNHRAFGELPDEALIGTNPDWASQILDIRQPSVQRFLLDRLIGPAMGRGFQGVFLDTLDSFRLSPQGQQAPEAFAKAQTQLLESIRKRYPDATIITNRGFHLPERAHPFIDALALESYREGYDPRRDRYRSVSQQDRDWLDGQLAHWREAHPGRPLIAIDYVPSAEQAGAVSQQLRKDGFIPYVTDPALHRLGPTQPRRVKRRVLVFHDAPPGQAHESAAHRQGGILLEQLGYLPVYRSLHRDLPSEPVRDRYAGILVWTQSGERRGGLCDWLAKHQSPSLPVVLMGLLPPESGCQAVTHSQAKAIPAPPVTQTPVHPSMGHFEGARLPLSPSIVLPQSGNNIQTWMRVEDSQQRRLTPVYTHPAGGVALSPYLFERGPDDRLLWLFNPIAFLSEALGGPVYPSIDTTTESGGRILTAHVDGDGLVSRAEQPGTPLSATVIAEEIIDRYRIPHTVSVIEAETAPDGLYPQLSEKAETIARSIFARPNVELASHSYSHPFYWAPLEGESGPDPEETEYGYALDVPGYTPQIDQEINGSTRYINRRLAPEDKSVGIFLWTGDAFPGERALRETRKAGLLNVNGGNTHPLPYESQLAGTWPVARPVGDELQVYAPVMNENVYTNLWKGPFFGYRNAIDTFRLLEERHRLKPIGIYYHFYSGTKPSALSALRDVYDYALSEPVTPLYLSDFARRARTLYRSMMLQGADGGYRWRGIGAPHTVRIDPSSQYPDLKSSQGVAGFHDVAGKRYVHLVGDAPVLHLQETQPEGPYLDQANAVLTEWTRQQQDGVWTLEIGFAGHQPLTFTLKGTGQCRWAGSGRPGTLTTGDNGVSVALSRSSVESLRMECF